MNVNDYSMDNYSGLPLLCDVKNKIHTDMEVTLNRVEIRGRVGQDPKIFNVGDTKVARFSVATNETFHDRDGILKEETTWHNVSAWSGRNVEELTNIKKGLMVSLVGRIRHTRYTAPDGTERYQTEVVANQLNIVKN